MSGGIQGFSQLSTIDPSKFTTMRMEDNLAPKYMPMLLKVISNLGFPAPVVTVGGANDDVPLQLADYLSRAGEPDTATRRDVEGFPVNITMVWPGAVHVQAATAFQAFANDLWIGFTTILSALQPGMTAREAREKAIEQMPELGQAFDKLLREISERGVSELKPK